MFVSESAIAPSPGGPSLSVALRLSDAAAFNVRGMCPFSGITVIAHDDGGRSVLSSARARDPTLPAPESSGVRPVPRCRRPGSPRMRRH